MTADFGWATTKVVARAARVNPRTVRRYIGRGKLEGKSQGERVNQRWLVSVDSLHALRASRPDHADGPWTLRGNKASEGAADNPADVLRDMAARLGEGSGGRAAQDPLGVTARTQSRVEEARGLRKERDGLRDELEAERSKGLWRRLFGG